MAKEYIHIDETTRGERYVPQGCLIEREKLVKYEDSEVLVIQKTKKIAKTPFSISSVIVPGFISEYKTKSTGDSRKSKISIVEPVPEKKRKKLEEILRKEGFKGVINFWD